MLSYDTLDEPTIKTPMKVRLEGRICGEIRRVNGGFQYFPKGGKVGGKVFESVGKVKWSLSNDYDDA